MCFSFVHLGSLPSLKVSLRARSSVCCCNYFCLYFCFLFVTKFPILCFCAVSSVSLPLLTACAGHSSLVCSFPTRHRALSKYLFSQRCHFMRSRAFLQGLRSSFPQSISYVSQHMSQCTTSQPRLFQATHSIPVRGSARSVTALRRGQRIPCKGLHHTIMTP
jgi:hypothetical protein